MRLEGNAPGLIDTHAHIYHKRFTDDVEQMIERARQAGVETIIVPATEPEEYPLAAALAERFPEVHIAVGVHPHSAATVSDAQLDTLGQVAGECNAIAIGEIGLDYYYDFAPKERQHEVFRRQLRLARELNLPAVIHNRESDDDVLRIIEEEQDGTLRFQLHCFSSGPDVLERALELGGMISFTGNITFDKSTLDDVVRRVPDDRLMIETDSPFMTPVPHRGKRNEPSYVGLVAQKIAQIRDVTPEKIALMTTQNARRFFALPLLILVALVSGVLSLHAQTPEPTATIDTVQRAPYDKLIGIDAHLAGTTFIIERATQASTFSLGFGLSIAPLQPLGVDWLQLDLLYTPSTTVPGADTTTRAILKDRAPEDTTFNNIHNTFNAWLHFIPNPRSFITFHASIGYTYFFNSYGFDQYIIEHNLAEGFDEFDAGYEESTWGLGGGLGLSINFDTPYGLFVPWAELTYSGIMGERDLPRYDGSFGISQGRFGLFYYPHLSKMLGLDMGD